MKGFLSAQIIQGETLVWKDSLPSWQPLRNSSLSGKSPKTPPPYRGNADAVPLYKRRSLWVMIIGSLILLCAVFVILWLVGSYLPDSANNPASAPLTNESQAVAPAAQSVLQVPSSPTPTPNQEVSSSNQIMYTGSFLNESTGDNGTLTLKVEHLIRTADGQIAIGGELVTKNSTASITGIYSPDTREVAFSPGIQSQIEWKGKINGASIKGVFTRHQSYSAEESGIWQVRHSDGPKF